MRVETADPRKLWKSTWAELENMERFCQNCTLHRQQFYWQ